MTAFFDIKNLRINGWQAAPKRAFNQAVRAAGKEVVRRWWSQMLPRHFRMGAASRYGYKKRSERHIKRTDPLPLVFTGLLQEMTRLPPRITGTAKKARAQFTVPGYIPVRYRPEGYPPIVDELTATTRAEEKSLGKYLRWRVTLHLRANKQRKRIRT